MKYGDFSSLLQLGVGIHLGTAILQLYGEFGTQPLQRRLDRIGRAIGTKQSVSTELVDQYAVAASDFEIFKIRYFNSYRGYSKVNTVVAILLAGLLTCAAYKADDPLSAELSVLLVFLSLFPGPLTVGLLAVEATTSLSDVKNSAKNIESQILKGL